MGIDEFVSKGWGDHAGDASAVADRLPEGLELATESPHLAGLAALGVHVFGEHLGRWDDGIAYLESLTAHSGFDDATPAGRSIYRSMAVLHRCRGDREASETWFGKGAGEHEASDRIRMLAVASTALAGQKRTEEAITEFNRALELASYGPDKDDPASRALAVTGNNLAAELEEKEARSPEEVELMKLAARTGRKYWEIAGNWMNVERAEYRLAMTHVQAGEAEAAVAHARECLEICEANGSDPGEVFFANEALAVALHAAGDIDGARAAREAAAALVEKQDDSLKGYCSDCLGKLDARLSA